MSACGLGLNEGLVSSMSELLRWFEMNATLFAVLVTAGVAVLLVCCLGCTRCPCREKDDLFKHHGV
jgi:hypothetical protein